MISTSASSTGPTSGKLNQNATVGNNFSWKIKNTTGGVVSVRVIVRVEVEGTEFYNESSEPHAVASGGEISDSGDLFLTFAPKKTGTHRVKSTTRVEDDGALGGPKESVSTNHSFPVSV